MTDSCNLPGQPSSTNPLQPTGYKFFIHRLPNVVYHAQGANLPALTLGDIEYQTPMSPPIPVPGDSVTFDPLTIKFIVDENIADWLEIYNWIRALARIQELNLDTRDGQEATTSDATLFILTSNANINIKVFFRDLFPVSITGLDFDSTVTEIDPLVGEVTFKYCYYEFEIVGASEVQDLPQECPTALPPP